MVFKEVLAVIIFLFIFAFINMFTHVIWGEMVLVYNASGQFTESQIGVANQFTAGFEMYDLVLVIVMVILLMAIGITSRKVASAPVFFTIMFVMSVFLGFISYFFNTLFFQMVSDSVFVGTVAAFPRTMQILTNLHWVALAAIVIGSIALYGKKEKGQFLA